VLAQRLSHLPGPNFRPGFLTGRGGSAGPANGVGKDARRRERGLPHTRSALICYATTDAPPALTTCPGVGRPAAGRRRRGRHALHRPALALGRKQASQESGPSRLEARKGPSRRLEVKDTCQRPEPPQQPPERLSGLCQPYGRRERSRTDRPPSCQPFVRRPARQCLLGRRCVGTPFVPTPTILRGAQRRARAAPLGAGTGAARSHAQRPALGASMASTARTHPLPAASTRASLLPTAALVGFPQPSRCHPALAG